jgi:hypothetical protein
MSKYVSFDIEIVKNIPDGVDWRTIRPLGISCAATMCSGDPRPTLWFHGKYGPEPLPGAMTIQEVSEMLDYLLAMEQAGFQVVSWNGLMFDFDVLAEESGRMVECAKLALRHVDMMFHVLCAKGFPLGLDKTAKGIGLTGKTEGMHGDLAPDMWAKSLEDRSKVLEYVAQDARTTLQVAELGDKLHGIQWISNSGKLNRLSFDDWLPVTHALRLKLPDTSWMTNPMSREQFYQWIEYVALGDLI